MDPTVLIDNSSSSSVIGNSSGEQAQNVPRSDTVLEKKTETVQPVEAIVDEMREADIFSSENIIVDDDFKLKMDKSLVLMILQSILLQVWSQASIISLNRSLMSRTR